MLHVWCNTGNIATKGSIKCIVAFSRQDKGVLIKQLHLAWRILDLSKTIKIKFLHKASYLAMISNINAKFLPIIFYTE